MAKCKKLLDKANDMVIKEKFTHVDWTHFYNMIDSEEKSINLKDAYNLAAGGYSLVHEAPKGYQVLLLSQQEGFINCYDDKDDTYQEMQCGYKDENVELKYKTFLAGEIKIFMVLIK